MYPLLSYVRFHKCFLTFEHFMSGLATLQKKGSNNMATSPKSPSKKDESFFDRLGTLGKKKKAKEAHEFEAEGRLALEDNLQQRELDPETFAMAMKLDDGEERSMIAPASRDDPKLKELVDLLLEWMNDELGDQRIVVKDIAEDMFDGQVLQKLIEHLTQIRVEAPEVTQSEVGQRQKLTVVLDVIRQILRLPDGVEPKWSVDSVHRKNLVAILHLLVALARYFRAPVRLPDHVTVELIVMQKRGGKLYPRHTLEELTGVSNDVGGRFDRDAFDTLFDYAPDKLNVVKKSLVQFVNKHLNKVNLDVTQLETQFEDGVYLVILMGLLEEYFVPLYEYNLTPNSFAQKVHNVSLSFDLMEEAGLARPKARPEDIVNKDLKCTLRVLYNLFSVYKQLN